MGTRLIAERLEAVRARISLAAEASGRRAGDVTLVAVSKTREAGEVREAYEAGQRDFGENYVQELVSKARGLSDLPGIRWHMIGHLQTNKVKQVLEVAGVVQTVDRVRLVRELGKKVGQGGLDVFVELNVGGEASKTGAGVQDGQVLVEAIREQGGLRLRGLMTVPPFELEPEETAVHFGRLRELARGFGLEELSMGMSHDFEVAIAHGATMVRVGTAIFGARR